MSTKSSEQSARRFGAHQCQYPGGKCTKERALKKNGERHWLCAEHRDHQNTMQRDRYRRTVSRGKKVVAKEKTVKEKLSGTKKTRNQRTNTKKAKAKRSRSSPHVFHESISPSTADGWRSEDDVQALQVERDATTSSASVRNELHETPPKAAPRGVEGSSADTNVRVGMPEPCSCTAHPSATPQPPQVVYLLLQPIPMTLGAPSQLCAVHHHAVMSTLPGALGSATAQGLQVAVPQVQDAVTPVVRPRSSPVITAQSHSGFRVPDGNVSMPEEVVFDRGSSD